jgi:hypothetical protein
MYREHFEEIVNALDSACRRHYGDRLVSLAVYGSVARGTMRPDSDIDLLVVADPLPDGRMPRVREFEAVETAIKDVIARAAKQGVHTFVSAVFYTPAEVEQGSPLFLDMTEKVRILFDREGFLASYLDRLRGRLKALGSKRIQSGGGWYWVLKPDLKPGERIDL